MFKIRFEQTDANQSNDHIQSIPKRIEKKSRK